MALEDRLADQVAVAVKVGFLDELDIGLDEEHVARVVCRVFQKAEVACVCRPVIHFFWKLPVKYRDAS